MLLAALLIAVVAQPPTEPSLSAGRYFTRQLAEGQVDGVWAARSAKVPASAEAKKRLAALSAQLQSYGGETRLISEGLAADGARWVYRRVASVKRYARGIELTLVLDERGRLVEGAVGQAADEAPTTRGNYRVKNTYRAPVEGRWSVLWGGRNWDENRHAAVPDMRYAVDLLVRGSDGRTCGKKPKKNQDCRAWNQPVVAAGSGVVVVAHDGVVDGLPNRPRLGSLYGNYVVIDHGDGEYSLYAHLRAGSVQVRPGTKVEAGDRLARTGSSGLSTEPHLHFQLMDHADYQLAQGLPVQLQDLVVNGRQVDRTELRRGDVFGPREVEASRSPK